GRSGPPSFDLHIAAVGPAQPLQRFNESHIAGLVIRIFRIHQCADASHALALSTRHQRPRRRAAYCCDEGAPLHSMTSSARASIEAGNIRPSAVAVLRFNTSSNLMLCSTGKSAALAPFRTFAA